MLVGLFFFIRASVKDRTEQVIWITPQAETELIPQLQNYFQQRSYQVITPEKEKNKEELGHNLYFEGFVRPSWFLAIFLSILAAIGLLCLALVLSLLAPAFQGWFLILPVLAPAAGIFYWKKAGRIEKVQLQVQSQTQGQTQLTITAHRDELIQLYQTGNFSSLT